MVELADTLDLGSKDSNIVRVQVPLSVLPKQYIYLHVRGIEQLVAR